MKKPIISKYYQKYMKIKLADVVNSKDALQKLLETKLPVKTSYALNKLVVALNPELEIYNKKRNELIVELGEKGEGDSYTVKKENLPKYAEEIQKLIDIDIDVEFTKLKVEDLGNAEIEPTNLPIWLLE